MEQLAKVSVKAVVEATTAYLIAGAGAAKAGAQDAMDGRDSLAECHLLQDVLHWLAGHASEATGMQVGRRLICEVEAEVEHLETAKCPVYFAAGGLQ